MSVIDESMNECDSTRLAQPTHMLTLESCCVPDDEAEAALIEVHDRDGGGITHLPQHAQVSI